MDFRQRLRAVRRRPGMFVGGSQIGYDQLVAFLIGMDIGSDGVLLDGFQEFVILKFGQRTSVWWPGLVCQLSLPSGGSRPADVAEDALAVEALFDLLDEFLAEMSHPGKRVRLHHEFLMWSQTFDSYHVELDRFRSYPAPPVVEINDAAAMLGLTKHELLDMIADHEIEPFRVGAQVFVRERDAQMLVQEAAAGP